MKFKLKQKYRLWRMVRFYEKYFIKEYKYDIRKKGSLIMRLAFCYGFYYIVESRKQSYTSLLNNYKDGALYLHSKEETMSVKRNEYLNDYINKGRN